MPRFSRFISTHCLCCCSLLLATLAQGAQTPATVALGDLLQTYDGTAKAPSISTQPSPLPTQVVYRNLNPTAPAPISEVVFNDSPDPLFLSYTSDPFEVGHLSALGNLVQLAGSARKLDSCDVILVTYALASSWPALAAANPAGYVHPVTISIFEVNSTNQLVYLSHATQDILVPWRPLTQANGSPYPYTGYAFRATIPFTNGITLPERVMIVVNYRTQTYGFDPSTLQPAPLGIAGPYNALNVAYKLSQPGSPIVPIGSDVDPNVGFQVKDNAWQYPATITSESTRFPMIRLRALSTESTTPPTNAGNWQATARVSNADYLGTASNTFTIQPAAATVEFGNLTQIIDGNPKPVTVTTTPPNLALSTTYSSAAYPTSPTAPSALGLYTVQTQITNPNYTGAASGQFSLIGHSLDSWLSPWVINNQIPANATGANDDPDLDSIPNLLEYALALDPSTSNHGLTNFGIPEARYSSGQLSLIFRKNLAATDLDFQVESAAQLGGPESWSPAITTTEVVSTVGVVQTIRASVTTAPGDSHHFLRLKVTRQDSP